MVLLIASIAKVCCSLMVESISAFGNLVVTQCGQCQSPSAFNTASLGARNPAHLACQETPHFAFVHVIRFFLVLMMLHGHDSVSVIELLLEGLRLKAIGGVNGQICMLILFYRFFSALSTGFFRIKKFQVFFKIWPLEIWGSHAILMGGLAFKCALLHFTHFPTPPRIFELETSYLDSRFLIKFRNF